MTKCIYDFTSKKTQLTLYLDSVNIQFFHIQITHGL